MATCRALWITTSLRGEEGVWRTASGGFARGPTHRNASSPTRWVCPCCGTGRPAPRRVAGRCSRTWLGCQSRRRGGRATEPDTAGLVFSTPGAGRSYCAPPPRKWAGRRGAPLPPSGHEGRDATSWLDLSRGETKRVRAGKENGGLEWRGNTFKATRNSVAVPGCFLTPVPVLLELRYL